MENMLDYPFSVKDNDFLFDGNNLVIYEINNQQISKSKTEKDIGFDPDRGTFLRSVALNLINDCNLNCRYCIAKQGKYDNPGKVMSLEIAQKSVDLLIDSAVVNQSKYITIGFFGGEPLLVFDLIKEIVSYANKKTPKDIFVQYLITTNGTLLKSSYADFMQENQFRVMLSIDGDKNTNDSNRIYPDGFGSYDDVVRAMRLLLGKIPVNARITVTEGFPSIDSSIKDILSLGIKKITYAVDYSISDSAFRSFLASIKELFDDYLISIRNQDFYDISNITEPITSIVLQKRKRTHCNAGISYLSVSAEGEIYRCPRFTGNKLFSYGNIQETKRDQISIATDQFKKSVFKNNGEKNTSCATCPFKYLCGGMCYHHAFTTNESEFSIVSRECSYRKLIFRLVLNLICSLTTSERRNFLLFLNQFWNQKGGGING